MVEIERPVEEVFAFLTEPANLLRWRASVLRMRPHRRGPLRQELAANALRLKPLLEENRAP